MTTNARKLNARLLVVVLAPLLATAMFSHACSKPAANSDAPSTAPSEGKHRVLIVCLSRTENTRTVAEIIQQHIGGDLVQLEPVTPYPADYRATVEQVDGENKRGYLPPLKTRIDNMKDYDTVFVGFPTWDMQLPPPVKSFLRDHDLSAKKVIPFNTNGGYGKGSSFQTVREMCPRSNVLEGFSVEGGRERDGIGLAIAGERREAVRAQVAQWLRDIRIVNNDAKP